MKIALCIPLLIFFSCSSMEQMVSDKEILLTSTAWTVTNNAEAKLVGNWFFKPDGTYIEDILSTKTNEKIILKGNWGWESHNEIYIIYTEMNVLGKNHIISDTDEDKRIFRITEISKQKLVGIKHHIGDAEDSGFASEVTYIASR